MPYLESEYGRCYYEEKSLDKCWTSVRCLHGKCTSGGNCDCSPNWIDMNCDICCEESRCNNGRCSSIQFNSSSNTRVAVCVCEDGYSGQFCDRKAWSVILPVSGTELKEWLPLTVVCLLMTIIAMSLVVALYYLWLTGRLPSFLQRIIWHFKKWEDDDGLQYDAVLSYADADVHFVRKEMCPRLDHLKYRTWLRHRDGAVGSVMQEEIISVIDKSRRTVLVISPNYIREEWPSLYHQVAFNNMIHKKKHKIIPIILEDISNITNVESDLMYILNTVPVLRWPQDPSEKKLDRLWEKMEMFMPKLKSRETTTDDNMNRFAESGVI